MTTMVTMTTTDALDNITTVPSTLNFELIIFYLLKVAENHKPVPVDKEIINQANHSISTCKYSSHFEAFLCAFDEWMQK